MEETVEEWKEEIERRKSGGDRLGEHVVEDKIESSGPVKNEINGEPLQHLVSAQQHPYTTATSQYPYYPNPTPADPDQDYYIQYYTQQSALSTPAPGTAYELRRSRNQLGHYFDTARYPLAAPPPHTTSTTAARQPPKVTKKDVERFKRRKEEKKRMKNKWLYE